jgi:imidazolonepropionase-like amidohydrolase
MMQKKQSPLHFKNCIVWTGEIGSAAPREVLVEGRRIAVCERQIDSDASSGAVAIDCGGATLMPGLVDGHSHLSFLETANMVDWGFLPPEEHTIATMQNAERVLLAGFTSCIGASSAKPRLDIAVRNEINAGRIPGPRLLAATPEITVTGGLGDERLMHIYRESVGAVLDGADAIRTYVRTMCREGCDIIKLNISGNNSLPNAPATTTLMIQPEIDAAVTSAHAFGKRVMSHARSSESVQLSLKSGIDFINHCEYADERTIDMLEEYKDRVFLAPAFGMLHNMRFEGERWGITRKQAEVTGLADQVERCASVYQKLRKRGLRVLIGGDYGFAWTPHGTNARDLHHFVNWFGYSPEEALLCATRNGAEAMLMGDQIGRVKQGYLADFILVNGKPYEDIACLTAENILITVKDGEPFGPNQWPILNAGLGKTVTLLRAKKPLNPFESQSAENQVLLKAKSYQ